MLRDQIKSLTQNLTPLYGNREAANIAQYLAEEHFGKPFVRTNPTLDATQQLWWEAASKRLLSNEPVQYVLGKAWFYGQQFTVNPAVLIPRPETEELVETIIKSNPGPGTRILDIGTGSGCIAITLSLELPQIEIFAIDNSPSALEVAAHNAASLGAKVSTLYADILHFETFADTLPLFHVIVSNPPYIDPADRQTMHPNVLQYEPQSALFADHSDPLVFYSRIGAFGMQKLQSGGHLYFEIPETRASEIQTRLTTLGYQHLTLLPDLQGKPRILIAQKP
ncbi:MAG: peptide chain release factor N(5)-glutamine methyltransferase [Bacteroidetes bacterium]|nr:peptide chain release factor N(5)-glutamine methyltransferase [Bacteroidota bacterium]